MATTKTPARKGDPETDDEPIEQEPQGDPTDWKAEARKWERRAKEARTEASANAAAADRVRELEDSDKSEAEKANRRVAEAEAKATAAEARALRVEVALDKGLTLSQARRLVGTTREELETDADELVETFGGKKADDGKPGDGKPDDGKPADDGKPDPRRRPREQLRSGSVPDSEPEADPEKIADAVLKQPF